MACGQFSYKCIMKGQRSNLFIQINLIHDLIIQVIYYSDSRISTSFKKQPSLVKFSLVKRLCSAACSTKHHITSLASSLVQLFLCDTVAIVKDRREIVHPSAIVQNNSCWRDTPGSRTGLLYSTEVCIEAIRNRAASFHCIQLEDKPLL